MIDILIGVADGYVWNQLRNWVLSSKVFDGKRVLLVYRMDEETKRHCINHNVEVIEVNNDIYGQPINHDERVYYGAARTVSHELRFFHIWQYLIEQRDVRYVILTDTRDVIFQLNPIKFLESHIIDTKKFLAPQEGLLYKDEPWNANNMYRGYGGYVWEYMKDKPIYNCGTIAGIMPDFANIILTIWSMTTGKHVYPADQCSTSLLVETSLEHLTYKCPHDAGWCCQCGVMVDPSKTEMLRPHFLVKEPILADDGYVYTSDGKLYNLVHQYERCERWLEIINKRYKE